MSDLESPSFNREETVVITKEDAPFAPEEQLGEYTLRRWSWYEKQAVVSRSSEIIDEKRGIIKMLIEDYYAEMLHVTVREYPESIEWSLDFIKKDLDPDVGDILRETGRVLNGLTEKEKRIFLPQSEQDEAILT
ncbi:unnamed protein product [marine sediment metagenome]|uniref:Uncharacterized protein n=1 Tax=marine sediment metagenome TaxID=412755 RepID=X1JQG1_9ZZZZ